jgi:hypothetical protein
MYEDTKMSNDVQRVIAYVQQPTANDPVGQVTEGFYKVDGDVLIMTDREGKPMRNELNGEIWSRKLEPDANPRTAARVLTLQIRGSLRGISDFHRPINYGDIKKVVPV